MAGLKPMRDTLARRIFCRVVIDPVTGCWNWLGYLDSKGYGQVRIGGRQPSPVGRTIRTHIVVWEMFNGAVPQKHDLHHECENKRCCNISHLLPMTHREHMRVSPRTVGYKASQRRECPRGHLLEGTNLIASDWRNGIRRCRICANEQDRVRYRLQREGDAT